eukprot:1496691-Prymnesium_polylepis.1
MTNTVNTANTARAAAYGGHDCVADGADHDDCVAEGGLDASPRPRRTCPISGFSPSCSRPIPVGRVAFTFPHVGHV